MRDNTLRPKEFDAFIERTQEHLLRVQGSQELETFIGDLDIFLLNLMRIIAEASKSHNPKIHIAALIVLADVISAFGKNVIHQPEKTLH